ncbi:glycosyltransferase family 4 protein [bacterium]|nr:glycosyltransferase family 4 protein [bacterium]
MKILMINKFYFVKGGVGRYISELTGLLESQGHTVIPFAMQHENNLETPYASYFLDNIEFDLDTTYQKILQGPKIIGRVLYSLHARKKLAALIKATQPDVAHLHMIDHQISPSILHTLKQYKIPTMQMVHQYKMICPSYLFYIAHRNEICERCLGGRFYNATLQRCHKHSLPASALISVESYLHKWLKLYEYISLFHTPSQFMRNKLIEGGIASEKIIAQQSTVDISAFPYYPHADDYYLYYGRLSPEKGVMTLLKALTKIKSTLPCYIIGEGPQREELETFAKENGLSQVHFTGFKSGDDLKQWVGKARFIVVPSECYENSPLAIYEAFSMGTPVIGARTGGIPEFIPDERYGLIYPRGDWHALSEKIDYFLEDKTRTEYCRPFVREHAEKNFDAVAHCRKILEFYNIIMQRSANGN